MEADHCLVGFLPRSVAQSMISVEVKCIFSAFQVSSNLIPSLYGNEVEFCENVTIGSSLLHADIENMWRWWSTEQSVGQIFLTIHNWNTLRLFFEIFLSEIFWSEKSAGKRRNLMCHRWLRLAPMPLPHRFLQNKKLKFTFCWNMCI